MIQEYLQNLKNYRSNAVINSVWLSPDLWGCLLYAASELGEVADCLVTLARPNDHRNNPENKHANFQKELQDVAMMVGSMMLLLDPDIDYFSSYNSTQYENMYPEPNAKWWNSLKQVESQLTEQYRLYTLNDGEIHKWGILSTGTRIIALCGLRSDLLAEQKAFFERKTAKILGHNNFIINDGFVRLISESDI